MPKSLRIALTAILYAAIYAFWLFVHPEALTLREQYQMFLLTADYAAAHATIAGGAAEYLAEAITQFFFYPAAGAMLITLLIAAVHGGVWGLSLLLGADKSLFGLSFIAPLTAIWAMGDVNVSVTLLVALAGAAWMAVTYAGAERHRVAWQLVAIPLAYWALGPAAVAYAIGCMMVDIRHGRWAMGLWPIAYLAGAMTLASVTVMSQNPTEAAFASGTYVSTKIGAGAPLIVTEAACALLPAVIAMLPKVGTAVAWAGTLVVAVAGGAMAISDYDAKEYAAIEYEQLVRGGKWDDVIAKAQVGQPTDAMSLTCVNLALAMKGQLLSRMFEFDQIGPAGLIARSERNQMSAVPSAEALFRLGMVNSAQHYFYDSQEAIADYRKSSRLTKRIAETLIVNGRYELAHKYIERLKRTLFYSHWANEADKLLGDETAIAAHPVYGRLRSIRHKTNFFMNYYEMDKMLGLLYSDNHSNKMALDYYVAQCLLRRDIGGVMACLGWVREEYGSDTPRHVQEAVAMAWGQTHSSLDGAPIAISASVRQSMMKFISKHSDGRVRTTADRNDGTLWHYMLSGGNADASTGATVRANDEQTR
ncbi:MAG: DUF6057 family protein [Marinilabiliaceae bacterium]